MSTFVIKVYEFGGGDHLYVCEDERLWEWLIAEDVLLGHRGGEDTRPHFEGGSLRVLCPEGYVFYANILVPFRSDVAINPFKPILSDFGYVSANFPDADKIHMLIISPCDYVTPIDADEFKALGIGNDRVFEITV